MAGEIPARARSGRSYCCVVVEFGTVASPGVILSLFVVAIVAPLAMLKFVTLL
jgi:hypothetical protein